MSIVHARTAIRDAVAAIVTGLSTTGSRVHKAYAYPKSESELPCLMVRIGDERIEAGTVGQGQDRTLDIIVSGLVQEKGDLDATLNQIGLEVEQALIAASPTLGGLVADVWLTGIQSDLDTSLQKPCGRIDLTFQAIYFTTAGDPGVTT